MTQDLAERFWARVAKASPYDCWEWEGAAHPYGTMSVNGKTAFVHRIAYELANGSIPEGLHIDHLCRNKRCVNPDHLEAVAPGENVLRGVGPTAQHARRTHCINGHAFDEENTYIRLGGGRTCRKCQNRAEKEYKARRRAEAA